MYVSVGLGRISSLAGYLDARLLQRILIFSTECHLASAQACLEHGVRNAQMSPFPTLSEASTAFDSAGGLISYCPCRYRIYPQAYPTLVHYQLELCLLVQIL